MSCICTQHRYMTCTSGKQSHFNKRWLIWDRPCSSCTPLRHSANHRCESAPHRLAPKSESVRTGTLARNVLTVHQRKGWPCQSGPESHSAARHNAACSCSCSAHTTLLQRLCQCCEVNWHSNHLNIPWSSCVPWKGRNPQLNLQMAVGGDEVVWGGWNNSRRLHVKSSLWSERL
jgi:hypothetical protein